jgi:signal transduction histidine kinase
MTNTRHTVLVVDDEPDVVKSMQALLRLDYKVLGATSAADGMRLMQEHEVHVVMTDQRMPEMTGVEFLHHVRGDHPEATRLLFTGYADIRAVIDAINQGNVYRYITKPWDPDELHTVIREACERYDLIVARQRLLKELENKNRQLEQTNAELAQANALKTAFIEVASHELRTPLTILLGMTDLAARAPGVQDPLRGWLERIRHAGERLVHLVNQLITMLSVGRFDRPLERRPVDAGALLDEAVHDVEPFVELRQQSLARDWPADLGTIHVEPAKVRDSINHLLLNAIKFTPDGGRISVAAARAGDGGITIRVGDTGTGIDAAAIPRIFDPFFTGYDTKHHSSGQFEFGRKGLGLGLSIVKKFAEMHGGRLAVVSEPGRGTTFTLTLPPAPSASSATTPPDTGRLTPSPGTPGVGGGEGDGDRRATFVTHESPSP